MSTSVTSAKDAPPSPPSSSGPIRILATQAAPIVRIAQPALLGTLFLTTFRLLVADPVLTMRYTLPATTAIQIAYAIACLPPAGSSIKPKRAKLSVKKTTDQPPNVFVTAVLALVLSLLVTPALHLVLVLFGAPFLYNIPHTLLLSAHASLLGVFPLLYARGVDSRAWRAVAAFAAPIDEVFGGLVGAAAGAWLGAVPIPLDWDREWQRWPVTVLSGLWAGYVLGKVLGGTVAFGVRFGTLREDKGAKKEQ